MVDIYEKVAKSLYERFVTNSSAVAVQHENGFYLTIKTPITPEMIKMMLKGGFSLGTYQQQLYNDKLRWICFDFDTNKKEQNEEEVKELKELYVIPFTRKLQEKGINYYVEFSGRRGFHVWVFLNQIISKDLAYTITSCLIGNTYSVIKQSEKFGIDLFPKTKSGKIPNKYGLQVKLPLSRHEVTGTYSYFVDDLENFKSEKVYAINDTFLESQLCIINSIQENDINEILKKCGLESKVRKDDFIDYHKQFVCVTQKFLLEDVKGAFCSDRALSLVWNHICAGTLDSMERILLLGIFGHMDCGDEILSEIFKLQDNYKKLITQKMLLKYKKVMFPITFKYLYQYLHLEDCPKDKENIYLDDFVLDYLGIDAEKYEIDEGEKEVNFIKGITEKEINYFYYNDEVYDFDILYEMMLFSQYDYSCIEKYIEDVESGIQSVPKKIDFRKFIRKEADKERILVTLGAKERIVTTALINKLITYCQKDYKSYSYHLNLGFGGDVFYPWVSSWTRFKNDISQYFSVPIFEDFYCIKIDFRSFYDSIFLHTAIEHIRSRENIVEKKKFENIYSYLLQFNEKLMREVNNTIQGVPQGPAYARVLAELTMDELIEQFMRGFDEFRDIRIYRYVDDMFVFGSQEKILDNFLDAFSVFFENKNLFLNKKKTKKYGKIKDLLPQDKNELQEFRDFNYDIFQLKDASWEDDFGKEMFDSKYLRFIYRRKEWDINDANLIFSDRIDSSVKEKYITQFYVDILRSEIGRGSMYRKFYSYIFSENQRLVSFFENKDYEEVPSESINQENLLCCMILFVDSIKDITSEINKKDLSIFLETIQNRNASVLQKLLQYAEED